jgi:predicted 3-demethylubiquinone-9 3-methyltransferase (glyoxalase superfamily)
MQKIIPFLWFDNQAEEAIGLYTSLFANSAVFRMDRIPDGPAKGNVIATYQLAGQEFMAIDGGPHFHFSPAVSLFVSCETKGEVDRLYATLSDGGHIMMPLDSYPFSERYTWLADKYGVSWQLFYTNGEQGIAPCLLFTGEQHGRAEEAMNRYTGLFDNSGIQVLERYGAGEEGPEGSVKFAAFTLHGQGFIAMENPLAHEFTFTHAISFFVKCADQNEVDALWEKLSDGGEIEQCGWLRDPFGVSWQIVPTILDTMLHDDDPKKRERVMNALLQMKKIEVAGLQQAFDQA